MTAHLRDVFCGLVWLLAGCLPAGATEPPLRWQSDATTAWKDAQSEHKYLLVFVTRSGCGPCQRMKVESFADPALAKALAKHFVALQLDGSGSSPLLSDLRVQAYPATFIISRDAVIVDRIDGYVDAAHLGQRLAASISTTTVISRQRPVTAPR